MKPVDLTAGLKTVVRCIESSAIDYMIVGSIAGIRGVLANTQIDQPYLDDWLKKLDLVKYFARV